MNDPTMVFDVEIFANYGEGHWAQEKYLVHTHEDVYWTTSADDVASCIREALVSMEKESNNAYQKGLADGVAMKKEMEKARPFTMKDVAGRHDMWESDRPDWHKALDDISDHRCSLCTNPANTRIAVGDRGGEKDVYYCDRCIELMFDPAPRTDLHLGTVDPITFRKWQDKVEESNKAAREARRKRGLSW